MAFDLDVRELFGTKSKPLLYNLPKKINFLDNTLQNCQKKGKEKTFIVIVIIVTELFMDYMNFFNTKLGLQTLLGTLRSKLTHCLISAVVRTSKEKRRKNI